jgi:hypothetical protein
LVAQETSGDQERKTGEAQKPQDGLKPPRKPMGNTYAQGRCGPKVEPGEEGGGEH